MPTSPAQMKSVGKARQEAEDGMNQNRPAEISKHIHVDRLKDEFVATVSHELRTPVTSISGSLALLAGSTAGNLPESAARLLSVAIRNSQRLVLIVNDILDIEKMESGEAVFAFRSVEVRPLIDQAIEANHGFAESCGVQVRLEPGSEANIVSADPDRLVQAVTNLLANAIKFSPPGLEVTVAVQDANGRVRISVRDHGPGIPEAFKSQIFEKFTQVDSSDTRQKGGPGLGLSIVKEIVRRHGGAVDVLDAPGGGTVLRVDLPHAKDLAPASRDIGDAPEPGKPKILVVEDEQIIALQLREHLVKLGYGVLGPASSGKQALRQIEASRPDLVLMDIHIKGKMDGIETAARINREYGIPVVYLTAYAEETTLRRARDTKPFGYLIKPFSDRELHATIQMALERCRDEHGLHREPEAGGQDNCEARASQVRSFEPPLSA